MALLVSEVANIRCYYPVRYLLIYDRGYVCASVAI